MNKKVKKNIIIILISIIVLSGSFYVKSYANITMDNIQIALNDRGGGGAGSSSKDPIDNPDEYQPNITAENEIGDIAGKLLGVINVIGVVCSIIVIIIIGIKYMLGSIEEKAEYKKTIWVYVLGIFLFVSATTIPNIIYQIMQDII